MLLIAKMALNIIWTRPPYDLHLDTTVDLTKYRVFCRDVQLGENYPTLTECEIGTSNGIARLPTSRYASLKEVLRAIEVAVGSRGGKLSFVVHSAGGDMLVSSDQTLKLPKCLKNILGTDTIEEGDSILKGPFNFQPKLVLLAPFVNDSYLNGKFLPVLAVVDILSGQWHSLVDGTLCVSSPSLLEISTMMVDSTKSDLLGHYNMTIGLTLVP